ncbi:hypothetical protein IP84_04595 [beta proteobacterium AAP99]|nr:hypothetical protein IP84_04595 [beta proteobacterium AAP99]
MLLSALAIGLLALALGLWPAHAARAEGIESGALSLTTREDGYFLSADYRIELPQRLEEALLAVPLFFVFDYDLEQRRWYWLDKTVASGTVTYRLSFNALTRQYRVAINADGQRSASATLNFASLEEALRLISRVRREAIVPVNALERGERYRLTARLRLDLTQLPKPFQLNALTQREWLLDSELRRISIEPR